DNAAKSTFDTPQKSATSTVLVVKRNRNKEPRLASRAPHSSPQSGAPLLYTSNEGDKSEFDVKKKARISSSPETKRMNPYQPLADSDDDTDEVVEIKDLNEGRCSASIPQQTVETTPEDTDLDIAKMSKNEFW
ncbi:hypothetical protein, partial [Janthinobacterium sp.]|uniref:hypothetical protein n=1 Tax=Janthinobacterium sp. TaxID=1871054 RepID=UPI00293DA0F1